MISFNELGKTEGDCASRFQPWVDKRFDEMVVSHGLVAMAYYVDDQAAIENALAIKENPHFAICCSDRTQALGCVGLYIKGKTYCVSPADLGSMIGNNGCRRVDGIPDLFDSIEEYEASATTSYTEHIKTSIEVVGVWWKSGRPVSRKAAQQIADTFGVPLTAL